MVYIILFLIAIIFIAGVEPLAKKVKIPFILFLILFGVLFSKYGIYDFFGYLEDINSNVSEIKILSSFSIEILFLIAGLSLSLTNIKKKITNMIMLSFLPTLIEWLVMGIFVYMILSAFSYATGSTLSIYTSLLVMGIFAMSSGAIVVPLVIEAKEKGEKREILDQISCASVVDNFLLIPLLAVCFTLTRISSTFDMYVNIFNIIYVFFVTFLTLVGSYVVGYVYGYLVAYIFNKFEEYDRLKPIPTAILIVLGSLIVINVTGILGGMLGLVTAFGIGIAFDSRARTPEIKIKAHKVVGQIYFNFFMPLIFIYIGINLRIDLLLNIPNLILIIIIVLVAIIVRSLSIRIYLKMKGYQKEERKVATTLFSAKGIMLIYYIPLFLPVFNNLGMVNIGEYMSILATVSIIITIPYCTIIVNKYIKKLES